LAKKWGIDEIILSDKQRIEDYPFEKGGVDRVLVTAPPRMIPVALSVCNVGAYVAFLGIDYTAEGLVTIDSTLIHNNTLQVRASNASPALFFPECIDIIKCGMISTKDLISHRFALEDIVSAIPSFEADKENAIKAVMER
jgi:threonine dehydrogenase-like Zn-dependent dehydrogenase